MKSIFYLASASPRRHELLNQIGVAHEILHVPSPTGEDEPRYATESPLEYVQRTAQDKANRAQEWISQQSINVSQSGKQTIILTADTTVALGNLVLGKPKDVKHASDILQLLSGKTHTVYTAVVLSQSISETNRKWSQWQSLSATQVSFAEMTEQTIEEYIATGEPFGKAGAYGIQGHAAKFISRIEGSYSGVMGLPLFETTELMKRLVK
ncbi:Maf family protein [Zwartia sp.]|uniref:Maf family protein n=1 Tax=Zwartia sp. TaxID=2978004 RepID=UPI003BAEEB98